MPTPRPPLIAFRLNSAPYSRVAAAALAAGLSPSAWCRRELLNQFLLAQPREIAGASTRAAATRGRPKAEPLSAVLGTKVTASQRADLEVRAHAAGLTIAAYLRSLIGGHRPSSTWPLARKAIAELGRVGNNLNQLTKLAHQGRIMVPELLAALTATYALLQRLAAALIEAVPE
jgi:hypothetical protein